MQKFIHRNITNILILLIVMVVLNFLEKLPYFNTFLSFPHSWNSLFILFFLTVTLFKLKETFTFGLTLLFLGIACFFSIFNKASITEKIGTIVYFLMWFALLQIIVAAWIQKNEKK